MMDWTDRHCRYFHRQLTQKALLFTEMVTAQAIVLGDRNKLLTYHPKEHPIALQLGGNDPVLLSHATKIATDYGYDEINLNVGCPSDRVQAGCFGLALMKTPEQVVKCFEAMQAATHRVVSIKTRIGVDELDSYEYLYQFLQKLAKAGCSRIYLHARKGWLKGLSPKENRTIPPLDYARVYQAKRDFPQLHIGINGGIESLEAIDLHLKQVDSVMLGRAAYHNPYLLAYVDQYYGHTAAPIDPEQAVGAMLPYIENEVLQGTKLSAITRHMLGLFAKRNGAKQWRRYLSQHAPKSYANTSTIQEALKFITPIESKHIG